MQVGTEVLNHTVALGEMRAIASDPDEEYFFGVDNYAALNTILSKLQQGIVGIEGIQMLFLSNFKIQAVSKHVPV